MRIRLLISMLLLLCGCSPERNTQPLTVGAASNLTGAFDEIAQGFTQDTGIAVRMSYGATTQLEQQVRNGAPLDIFAAADTDSIDRLAAAGRIVSGTRAIYGRGQLALWSPQGAVTRLEDLRAIRFVALANPQTAPYGRAAVSALRKAGLWADLEAKIVYANNISMAKQYAASGNADATLTAYSLVAQEKGKVVLLDPALYDPLDQALGIVRDSEAARGFAAYVTGAKGRAILTRYGYLFSTQLQRE